MRTTLIFIISYIFGDLVNPIYLFIALYIFSAFSVGMKQIKENWPEYRCNPMIMPFAEQFGHDSMGNFVQCITNMQGESMAIFLKPIRAMFGLFGEISGFIVEAIGTIANFFSGLRESVLGNFGGTFSTFFNMIIIFQKLMIKIKDMLMKVGGVVGTIVYIFTTSMKMGNSFVAGPIYGVIDTLCFKHDTKIKIKNNTGDNKSYKKISDIHLGDILENGSEVLGLLKLKGKENNPFYRIWSEKLQNYIYVTGSHKILNNEKDDIFENYIEVSDFNKAEKTNDFDEELYCLITSDHRIPIGEYTFWDWED